MKEKPAPIKTIQEACRRIREFECKEVERESRMKQIEETNAETIRLFNEGIKGLYKSHESLAQEFIALSKRVLGEERIVGILKDIADNQTILQENIKRLNLTVESLK